MTIKKHGGSITLDPIPSSAKIGEVVTFSGTLALQGQSPEGAIIYIKDEDPGRDDLLATGYVDRYGKFQAGWIASDVDSDNEPDIYAVFEGSDTYYRLTTCDDGPTRSFGGLCNDTIPMRISGYASSAHPNPYTTEPFMELFYSHQLRNNPHVAIIPSPDEYDKVKAHIVPVQEGILMWTSYLESRYGGNWGVTFEVINPGDRAQFRPDVIVNLVTRDSHAGCDDYFGVAEPSKSRPVQSTVCSTYGGQTRTNTQVAATSAHEFIHAMGLGHAFNKDRDLMCSVENNRETCQTFNKSQTPSSLNLDAISALYGTDGFRTPNNYVSYGTPFFERSDSFGGYEYEYDNDYEYEYDDYGYEFNYEYVPYVAPTIPAKTNSASDCPTDGYRYDQSIHNLTIKPGWYHYYLICSKTPIHYYFATDNSYDGFNIFTLPPETDVAEFVDEGIGEYYICEEPDESWHTKSNTCNMEFDSHIVIYNSGSSAINLVDSYIRN